MEDSQLGRSNELGKTAAGCIQIHSAGWDSFDTESVTFCLSYVKNQCGLQKSVKTGKRLRAETPIFHKGKEDNPGNNMIVTVTSVTEKEHLLEIHFQT